MPLWPVQTKLKCSLSMICPVPCTVSTFSIISLQMICTYVDDCFGSFALMFLQIKSSSPLQCMFFQIPKMSTLSLLHSLSHLKKRRIKYNLITLHYEHYNWPSIVIPLCGTKSDLTLWNITWPCIMGTVSDPALWNITWPCSVGTLSDLTLWNITWPCIIGTVSDLAMWDHYLTLLCGFVLCGK